MKQRPDGTWEPTPVQPGAEARVRLVPVENQDGAGDRVEQLRAQIKKQQYMNGEFWDRIWQGLKAWRKSSDGSVQ